MRRHTVQFYDSDDYLCRSVAGFLAEGIAGGEPIMAIASESHRVAVTEHLRARAVDVDDLQARGRLILLDARATLEQVMVHAQPDQARFRLVIGGVLDQLEASGASAPVRAYGEMVDLLCKSGRAAAALRLEELWNDLGRQRSFSLMCAYVMGNFAGSSDATRFAEVCHQHTHALPTETFAEIRDRALQLREVALLQQRARALEHEVAQRRIAEETVRQASRAKDEFLAMLGHELRNPLAPIVTALHVMKLKGDVASSREQEVIERQVDHMVRLIDDLLDVSRITNGTLELHKRPFELSAAVARAVEMAAPLIEQRQHHISVNVPRIGMRLDGDEARIAQVLANLLTNAARYTPPGGRIWLSALRTDHHLVISAKDSGMGIKPELLPRIFDLFVQGTRSTDRAEGGLGIGLALVQSLVRMHSGTVHVVSDGPGKGSEFIVKLPAMRAERPAQGRADAASAIAIARTKTPRRVLIVDDNVDAAELLAELLRSVGHQVVVAHDGAQALRAMEDFAAELAFLDIGLPVMDGYELAARLRQQQEALRLIALTGYGQDRDRERSAAAGFHLHLVKPVPPARFLAAVESG